MKFLPAIMVLTIAALTSTAVVVFGDEMVINANEGSTNNIIPEGRDMPLPSATQYAAQKSKRMAERRARVKSTLANLPKEPNSKSPLHRMTEEELERASLAVDKSAKKRGLIKDFDVDNGGFIRATKQKMVKDREELKKMRLEGSERKLWGSGSDTEPYAQTYLVDETEYYDKWQQGYRFLGGYIDCEHGWGDGSHDSGGGGEENEGGACSRWMMWAAYIDPNYAGGEYNEYFGDNPPGSLDCHSPDTDWKLIGVYRQEFYQYIEQISKHLWAINEYEYIVALAGLAYMTDDECRGVGYDESGNQLYADVQPLEGGTFQMGLYNDAQCVEINTQTSYTYDDFVEQGNLDLGSGDTDDAFYQTAYTYWQDTQEYTLSNLNAVYNDFRFCTSCVDYPTYQDGYFIGDDGKDDDDLINQCWKFYSHDSFNVNADDIAMASDQGSITWISYGGKQFGLLVEGQYSSEHEGATLGEAGIITSGGSGPQRLERLKANLFLTFAGIVFVATFLAFAVARGSSKKKKKKTRSRSRRLLDADYGGSDRRSTSRSQSRSRRTSDGKSVRSSRSKSKSRSMSAKSGDKSSSARSKSRSRTTREGYEPPPTDEKKSSSRSQSRSRKTSSSRRPQVERD